MSGLVDTFGREIARLRLSLTDRCNLKCLYCRPDRPESLAHSQVLGYEEAARIARVAVGLGVEKVRITGGEPLLRKGVPELVRQLRAIEGLRSVALTTNGTFLAAQAAALRQAGLQSVNVSLDSLRAERLKTLCGMDVLGAVLAGLEEAMRVRIPSIKVNCVVIRGVNDDEICSFAQLARESGLAVRFIEFMPLDGDLLWTTDKVVPHDEILDRLDDVYPVDREPDGDPRDPARVYRFLDGRGEIGIIASVSRPFCSSCDRIRVTADGRLKACLFGQHEPDLRGLLRSGASDEAIARAIVEAVRCKERGRRVGGDPFAASSRSMIAIGG